MMERDFSNRTTLMNKMEIKEQILPHERPRDFITTTLARQILSGAFRPGDRLPNENELGVQLGVSRTALRESIRTLAGKGLVESRPRTGTYVLPQEAWNHMDPDLLTWREGLEVDVEFMNSLLEVRRIIEPSAAALAAERATGHDLGRLQDSYDMMCRTSAQDIERSICADEAFHVAVLASSHNLFLINFGAMIGAALRTAFRLTTSASDDYGGTLHVHGDVLEAIRMRRPAAAKEAMEKLLFIASADLSKNLANGHGSCRHPGR